MSDQNPITQLQERLLDLHEQAQVIQAKADAEERDLSEDEQKNISGLFEEFEFVEGEIERRQRIAAQTERLAAVYAPKAEKEQPRSAVRETEDQPAPQRSAAVSPKPRIQIIEDRGKWGWHHLGDFASAVRAASRYGGMVDPRLVANAPTTYGSEGVGADGGFAVPPDFRSAIMEKVMAEDSLLGRTDQLTSTSNSVTFPADETTPWQTTGGIQVYWEGEGDQLSQSKPNLKQVTVRLNKLAALVPVTEELLEDATTLDAYLRRKVPAKMDFAINKAIVQGTGSGQPLGILNAASLVSVAKETASPAQSADTVVYDNIIKMWSRMYGPCRSRAVWLINQDIEPQLYKMQFDRTASTAQVPVYLPANGAAGSPYATLMGRPVVPTQACETLGDKGDIFFVDLTQYLSVVKTSGIRSDVSIHLWFDYDTAAYRFIFRVAGQPWWAAAIDPRDGTNTLSWAVTLDERA